MKLTMRMTGTLLATLILLGVRTEACDTWVALGDSTSCGCTIFAKNSDRTVADCQPLFLHPRQNWPTGSMIDLGRTSIPQVPETFATLGSSPYWCWGFEEGVNEYGVAIGNEGIRTRSFVRDLESYAKGSGPDLGPTGMDLIRLGLERGKTAREALDVIVDLLETHGQFGSGLPAMDAATGGYENSFIIADPREAFVLETTGRRWIARRFTKGTTSISNTITIGADFDLASDDLVENAIQNGWASKSDRFDFTKAYLDPTPVGAGQRALSLPRAACSSGLLREKAGDVSIRWMMKIARDESSSPPINADKTASSCVAVLPESADQLPVFWWCPTTPSNSCFVPFFVHGSRLPASVSVAGAVGREVCPPSQVAVDTFSEDSYWWRFRNLCDLASGGVENRTPEVRAAFDSLEKQFEAAVPNVVAKAVKLRAAGKADEAAAVLDAFSADCVTQVETKLADLRKRLSVETETPEQYRPYVGTFVLTHRREEVEVLVKNGRLAVDVPNQRVYELNEPDTNGKRSFVLSNQVAVSFTTDAEGHAQYLTFHQGGLDLEGYRKGLVRPEEVDLDVFETYVGHYESAKSGAAVDVYVHNNRLVIDWPNKLIFELHPPNDDGVCVFRCMAALSAMFSKTPDAMTLTYLQSGVPADVFSRTGEIDGKSNGESADRR